MSSSNGPFTTAWTLSEVVPSEISRKDTFLCTRIDFNHPWTVVLPFGALARIALVVGGRPAPAARNAVDRILVPVDGEILYIEVLESSNVRLLSSRSWMLASIAKET
jgi:hypothetical protein